MLSAISLSSSDKKSSATQGFVVCSLSARQCSQTGSATVTVGGLRGGSPERIDVSLPDQVERLQDRRKGLAGLDEHLGRRVRGIEGDEVLGGDRRQRTPEPGFRVAMDDERRAVFKVDLLPVG